MTAFDVHIKVETAPHDTDLMEPNGGFTNSLMGFYKGTAVKIGEITIKQAAPAKKEPTKPEVKAGKGERS